MAIRLPIGFCNRSGSGDYLIQMRVACAPVHFDKQRRAIQLSIGFCNLLRLGRLSLTDESACATLRLLTQWKPLACSQWWCWRWTRVKSDITILIVHLYMVVLLAATRGRFLFRPILLFFSTNQIQKSVSLLEERQTGSSWLRGGDLWFIGRDS